MATTAKTQTLDQDKAMNAVLAMLVANREDRLTRDGAEPRKSEVILADAGLTPREISALVGKNIEAVTKTIQRARKPKKATSRTKKA